MNIKSNQYIRIMVILINLMCLKHVNPQNLTSDISACSRNSPELSECISNSLNTLKRMLPNGRLGSGFKVDSVDPLFVKELDVIDNPLLKISFYDIYINGVKDFDMQKVKASFDSNHLRAESKIEIPQIDMKSNYKIIGPLGIPQTGEINFSLIDFKGHGDTRVRLFARGGNEYVEVDSSKWTIDSTKVENVTFSLPIGRVRELGFFSRGIVKLFGEQMAKAAYRMLESRIDRLQIEIVNRYLKDVPASYFLSE